MAEYAYVGPVAHDSGNDNLPIHRIVVHCTAGEDAGSARGTAKYFKLKSATGSAHAITDPNELVISAYDTVVCWHAPPNQHSIGIEICCSLANEGKGHWGLPSHQKMLHRAARWVAEKCHEHGIPIRKLTDDDLRTNPNVKGICGHVDVTMAFHESTHTDPGPYFPWSQFLGYVTQEYKAIAGGTADVTPTEEDDMAYTEAELKQIAYDANEEYGANLWAAPTGTGTHFIRDTKAGLASLSGKIDALLKQEADRYKVYYGNLKAILAAVAADDTNDVTEADVEKILDQVAAVDGKVAALTTAEAADHPKG